MYRKGVIALTCLFFLVGQVHMECDKRIKNPESRAELIACARNHLPPMYVDIIRNCLPDGVSIDSLVAGHCSKEGSHPRVMEVAICVANKEDENKEEIMELKRTFDKAPLKRCIEGVEEPESEEEIPDLEDLFD